MGGVGKIRSFGPQHLPLGIRVREGRIERTMHKPRVFAVRPLDELMKLPGGIAPFAEGVTPSSAAKTLKTDIRAMYRAGFTAVGANVKELDESVRECGGRPIFGIKPREIIEVPEKESDEAKKERLNAFHTAVFNSIVGRVCDPSTVLEEFSLMRMLNNKGLPDHDKAIVTEAYLSTIFPEKTQVTKRAALFGENLVGFVSGSFKEDPSGKYGKWVFIALVANLLYADQVDIRLRDDFMRQSMEITGYSAQDAVAWLSGIKRNIKKS